MSNPFDPSLHRAVIDEFKAQTDRTKDSGRFIYGENRQPQYCAHGHREDVYCRRCSDMEAGEEYGAKVERARIVAWFASDEGFKFIHDYLHSNNLTEQLVEALSDAIERGEHND